MVLLSHPNSRGFAVIDVIDVMDVIAGSTGQTGEDCSSSGAPGRIMLHPSHLVEEKGNSW